MFFIEMVDENPGQIGLVILRIILIAKELNILSYTECKNYIADNFRETKNKTWWINLDKSLLPINIPKRPDVFYKNNGWVSWEIFF